MLKSSLSACDPQEAFGCRSFASGLIVFGSMPSQLAIAATLAGYPSIAVANSTG